MIQRLEWWQLATALVLGGSLLEPKPLVRAALAGLVPALLGAAALAVAEFGTAPYVSAGIGLMLVGAILPLLPAWGAVRGHAPGSTRSLPGAVILGVAGGAIIIRVASLIASIEAWSALAWALLAPAGWWLLVSIGRVARLGTAMTWLDRQVLARQPPSTLTATSRVSRVGAVALGIGALLAGLAPDLWLLMLGLVMAAVGAELVFRPGRRMPVLLIITLLALLPCWLIDTVAGPVGSRLDTLADVPMSSAAARLAALPLGLVAWAWMGLWPLHGVVQPVMLAPLGALLWLRFAEPVAHEGLAHWQPLFVLLAVVGLWHAAWDGRLGSVLVALGFEALASVASISGLAFAVLLVAAFAFRLPKPSGGAARTAFGAARRLGFVTAGLGAMLAFAAGLGAEVVLTAFAAAGLAYGFRAASPLNDL
ncbi:MAG TPA: hypothetical protein VFM14_01495 [Gemmatimonadales bacterium]|nr:hypothetical protein [Gemmatimonadales bacterium]